MGIRLGMAALVELIYALTTRVWLPQHFSGTTLELAVTAGRLVSLAIFFLLFRQLILGRTSNLAVARDPRTVITVGLLLISPVLIGNYSLPDLTTQMVFAITSVAVALKEEFLYRGVLQNLLERRFTLLRAIVLSNIVFTLYHYGAQPFTFWNLTEIFCAGCILGLLYAATGSMALVVGLHAVNDAIWSFTPLMATPLPRPMGSAILLSALIFYAMWYLRSNKVLQTDAAASRPRG